MINNSIIICDNNIKKEILKSVNSLVNIKFYNMNEFIKKYYFDYDEKSILYIIKKYGVKYEMALEYLNNLIYVEDKYYNQEKLDFLVKIKRELSDNDLLIIDKYFKNYVKDKEILIYNYNLSKFEKHLLNGLNIKEIKRENNNYKPVIYEFNDIEDEVEYVARSISNLIANGISIDNIKLTNVSSDYINVIEKIFNFYNLKINKHNNIPIISSVVGKTFFDNLSSIENGLESIKEYEGTNTYNKIIEMCNKYVWCTDIDDLKILISYSLNHTYIQNQKYTNEIEVVDYNNYDFKDTHVFMLGFNQGIIPVTYKDEDYISDSKKLDYMDTTLDKNIKSRLDTLNTIKNIKNLTITYKLKSPFNTYYPSNLIDEIGVEVKHPNIDYTNSYSIISDSITLTNYLDNLIKFGEKSDNLNLLSSNYDIPYNTYSHYFTGINNLNDYIKSKKSFNLSYSTMDDYNRCSFKFYVEKILNLKKNINKFSVELGNIYHYVLEKAIKGEVCVKEEVEKYIKDNNLELTNSNRFFINRTIENIEYLIEVLKDQNKFSKLKKVDTEKFIKVNIKDNINFVGFIDKIVYDTFNDITLATIIDYKTYVKKPSLKYIDSGIGLQLPTYMYLARHAYRNVKFIGFYLQNITLDNKSDEEKLKSLKLIGYTNKDTEKLEKFDYNYADSSVIDGLKVKKDGTFTENSLKVMLSDDEIDEIIKITEVKINETIDNILKSKFDINPKYDNGNIGCEFCEFSDICYKKEYDFVNILGGEKSGMDS